MSRYIDLDGDDCVWCGNPGEYENWNVPLDMPGADVAPVKHGHWVWSDDLCEYCCSRCGHTDDYGIHPDIEYCPYCGAKMDEVTGFGM